MGRIANGQGLYDNYYWPSIAGRFVRLTLHAASSPEGAIVKQIKLRVLSKDRMPIGKLERAARAGRGELYPQSLLGRQVYWTVLAEAEEPEKELFDEYGNLEPQQGGAQITPLLRVEGNLHGAPGCASICCSLFGGSLPLPTVAWTAQGLEVQARGLAHAGQALVEYRVLNSSGEPGGVRSCWRSGPCRSTPIGSMAVMRPSTPSETRGGKCGQSDLCRFLPRSGCRNRCGIR